METTIYDKLGDDNLQKLVNNFYELVEKDPIISSLFKDDFETIKKKQFMFLSQFLGGPGRYTQTYGHPKMRKRHLPHQITNTAKVAWLACMKQAINTLPVEDDFKETLYNCFPAVAQHMVNS
ncbi:MAG: globin [Flavobacteriales bacterium]|nr:globin [Flavobacteriales bacterium]